MGAAIWAFIQSLLQLVSGIVSIKDKSLTKRLVEVKGDIKSDRLQDRDLKREAKILTGYAIKPVIPVDQLEPRLLYEGDKEMIFWLIKEDLADVLTKKQQRIFGRKVKRETFYTYFSVAIHPLTEH